MKNEDIVILTEEELEKVAGGDYVIFNPGDNP